jgi:hypothetical protein
MDRKKRAIKRAARGEPPMRVFREKTVFRSAEKCADTLWVWAMVAFWGLYRVYRVYRVCAISASQKSSLSSLGKKRTFGVRVKPANPINLIYPISLS